MKKKIKQAIALYESFREKKPRKIATLSVDVPEVAVCMGHVEFIGYRTTHGKKLTLYKHDFAAGSRPLLCVSADGRQLVLIGGRYQWTERGIVDRDARGKEIENAAHGEPITDPWDERTPSVLRRQANARGDEWSGNSCPLCTRRAESPWRVYDKAGKVINGCVAEFHTGHLVTPSESSRWHNRPEAKKIRAALEQQRRGKGARQSNARNHLGEKEYQTFAGWKRAAKAAGATWFDGDQDIAQAMTGPKPFKDGETRSIGEWDGATGSIFE